MSRRATLRAAALCVVVLAGSGCGSQRSGTVDWPSWGNTTENTHFADLAQVNPANVARLRVVWRRSEGPGQSAWETFPVVVGRTMYYTTDTDEVIAVDAATGRRRWAYVPRVDFFAGPSVGSVEPVSRGVAVGAGRVYLSTYDDQLIALDAGTGHRLWNVRIDAPELGYTENSPGTYWRGELILGGPAGDAGLRGFLAAFDARTGRRLWRSYMVPPRGRGWMPARGAHGGGDVWMPPVVDPRSGTVYAATGDPTPAFSAYQRPGCDPWTDATVALDARTGALEWGHTELCHDSWDYDTDQAPVLFDVRAAGRTVRAVGDGSKAGFYTTLDARTGAQIARTPELVRYSQPHRVPTRSGSVVCPGISGGLEYGPPAYSPRTRDLYVLGTDMCMRYTVLSRAAIARHVSGAPDLAGTATRVGTATGVIVAVDPASGRTVWHDRLAAPAAGGALATAGGLVFAGDDDGTLYGFGARTGRVLWRADLGLRFGSAPIAYAIDGREFIAVAAGGSQLSGDGARGGGELFVFSLPHG
jgi:PQQ-dependent dehydrogenase (methanol/ethanol family)